VPTNELLHLPSVLSTRKNLRAETRREGSGAPAYLISMTNPSIELPFCGADREERSMRPERSLPLSARRHTLRLLRDQPCQASSRLYTMFIPCARNVAAKSIAG